MQASSPIALLSALLMPVVFAYVVHGHTGTATDASFATGIAGVGFLDALIVLIVVSLLAEKQWRTLDVALGSPHGMVPVILGRLAGMTVQALISLPGTTVVLALLWGVQPGFAWSRWLVGGVVLAVATTSVVGLMAFVLLRYPVSPGMTNGLVGILMSLGALLVPERALPGPVRVLAWLTPQSHAMAWVRGAGDIRLLMALALSAIAIAGMVLLIRYLERVVRARSISLEA
jgi:hypothetical protein